MTSLWPFEFRDPAALIAEIARQVPLTAGSAYLALVHEPSTTQRLVRVDSLDTPAEIDWYDEAQEEMRTVVDRWPLPDTRPPRHASVLVLVRSGLCVFGPNEARWFMADRYLNHLRSLYTGDCILVTEHGWVDAMTEWAGAEPALIGEAA